MIRDCGCSDEKVKAGLCEIYQPDGSPRPDAPEMTPEEKEMVDKCKAMAKAMVDSIPEGTPGALVLSATMTAVEYVLDQLGIPKTLFLMVFASHPNVAIMATYSKSPSSETKSDAS